MVFLSQVILSAFALWLISIGIWSLIYPHAALKALSKMGSTNLINYTELGLRLIVGLAFLGGASIFQYPQISRIIGWFLVATSIILMIIPRGWHHAYAVYWSKQLPLWSLRLFMPIGISFGLILLIIVWR